MPEVRTGARYVITAGMAVLSCVTGALGASAARTPSSAAATQADVAEPSRSAQGARHLEEIHRLADLSAQRLYAWNVIASLTAAAAVGEPGGSVPRFEHWQGEYATFAPEVSAAAAGRGLRGFRRAPANVQPTRSNISLTPAAGTPVIAYTLYNDAAYQHMQRYRLYSRRALLRARDSGEADPLTQGPAVPAFPADAIVLKTIWWPVARQGITPLPVWDPEHNPPLTAGNGYTTWQRIVAIEPASEARTARDARVSKQASVAFAGRSFSKVPHVALDAFHHQVLDANLAERLMQDEESRRTAFMALGRPLAAGDVLVLVGGNLATKELHDWIWVAFWWHDRPDAGPFAARRPSNLPAPWRHYLMSVAFDAVQPVAADGGPHICFNPWLEGRFPDGGAGGGVTSNCMACHQRASYPSVDFLPVTRGSPDLQRDAAYEPGRLRTGLLWSLPLHTAP